jgi:O-antigen/teichoic acid export membrane protein
LRLLVPSAVAILAFPDTILWVLFGNRWLAAAPILAAFAPWIVLLPLFESTKIMLMARHEYTRISVIYVGALGVLVTGVLTFAKPLGPLAGAVANTASMGSAVLCAWMFAVPVSWRPRLRSAGAPILAPVLCILTFATTFLFVTALEPGSLLERWRLVIGKGFSRSP